MPKERKQRDACGNVRFAVQLGPDGLIDRKSSEMKVQPIRPRLHQILGTRPTVGTLMELCESNYQLLLRLASQVVLGICIPMTCPIHIADGSNLYIVFAEKRRQVDPALISASDQRHIDPLTRGVGSENALRYGPQNDRNSMLSAGVLKSPAMILDGASSPSDMVISPDCSRRRSVTSSIDSLRDGARSVERSRTVVIP